MDQIIALSAIVVIGALAWVVRSLWLRNASPETTFYTTVGGAVCMTLLLLLADQELALVGGILMALLWALAISMRFEHYRKSKHFPNHIDAQ